jgi:hypothetical protein
VCSKRVSMEHKKHNQNSYALVVYKNGLVFSTRFGVWITGSQMEKYIWQLGTSAAEEETIDRQLLGNGH